MKNVRNRLVKKLEVQEIFATAVCAFGNKDGGFVYLRVRSD